MKQILKITFATFLIMIFLSCQDKKVESFKIDGVIKGEIPKYLYLTYGSHKDSSLIKNGNFSFYGKVSAPILADFSISPISSIDDPFYIENSDMQIEINVEKKAYKGIEMNFIKVNKFEGTETVLIQNDFEEFLKVNYENDNKNLMIFKKLSDIIEQNPMNSYSADLLARFALDSTLNVNQLKSLIKKLDSDNPSRTSIVNINNVINPINDLIIGNTIFDFKLPNQKDEIVNTEKFRGKFLLLDFWASWCIPCRKQNPDLLNIYKEFNNKGFEILGVSLDDDRNKWLTAIKKDKLVWENVIESDAFYGHVATNYKVSYLPYNMLINKEGKIVAIDVKMSELRSLLNNINK